MQSGNATIAPCPLTTPTYRAWLPEKDITAGVGEKVRVRIEMDPAEPPMGFYVTTLVEVLDQPEGGAVEALPGFPAIALTPKAAGDYRIEVRINLVAKSSCAGVKAAQVGRDVLILHVLEAPPRD